MWTFKKIQKYIWLQIHFYLLLFKASVNTGGSYKLNIGMSKEMISYIFRHYYFLIYTVFNCVCLQNDVSESICQKIKNIFLILSWKLGRYKLIF